MATTIHRPYLQPPRKSAPETDIPTLRPGVDRMPTHCVACGKDYISIEPPLGLAPFGVATCGTCGCVLAHIARPLLQRPKREPTSRVEPTPASASIVERERDWRLPGCTAACFGGRHHPLAHEAY